MTKAEQAVLELRKENPANWAIEYATNMDELQGEERLEATLEFMWAFGVHFDYSTAAFILIIPHVKDSFKVDEDLCLKGIKTSMHLRWFRGEENEEERFC